MTSIANALQKVGFDKNEAQLHVDLARYLNNGGTHERLLVIVNELPDEGHEIDDRKVHIKSAFVRQTSLPSDGHSTDALTGHPDFANARQPNASEAGRPLPVLKEPSPAQRTATRVVSISASKTALKTALDTHKTSDGRAWGDVGVHELDGMERDGTMAKLLKDHIGQLSNRDRFKTVRELIKPDVFDRIRKMVRT